MRYKPLADQQGSISVLYVFMFTTVLLLLIAFVEREWVNYSIRLAEQTADFAAEAAVRYTAQVYDTVEVRRRQRYFEDRIVCDRWDDNNVNCLEERLVRTEKYREGWVRLPTTERETLTEMWRELARCGSNPDEPNWQCAEVRTVEPPEVRYSEETTQIALTTFWQNWEDRSAARVVDVVPYTWPSGTLGTEREVEVQVNLELRSLFGIGWGPMVHQVHGVALTRPRELTIPIQ